MWQRIEEGRNLRWLGEETLTDLFIRDLLRLRMPGFEITGFDKPAEGKNGADWEWWFQGSSGKWLGMRVQAKVIFKNSHKFDHLHYPGPKKSPKNKPDNEFYQSDKLIDLSKCDHKSPLVPIYMLYCQWSSLPKRPLRLSDWVNGTDESTLGCSIMAARRVMELRISGSHKERKSYYRSLYDVAPYMYPLNFLACNSFNRAGNSVAERIEEGLKAIGAIDKNSGVQYLLEEPPRYIVDLIKNKDTTTPYPEYVGLGKNQAADTETTKVLFLQTNTAS